MSETAPITSHDTASEPLIGEGASGMAQTNMETLRSQGEVGELFADLYGAALEVDPRLAEVKIWGIGPDVPGFDYLRHTGGSARHKDAGKSGRYEVVMNTTGGKEHYQRLLATRRASAEISAKKLGLEPGTITPKQLASFIFLHELGHIVDFMDNAPDKATHDMRRKRDKASLPVPGYDPTKLAIELESSEGRKWFFRNLKTLKSDFGVSSFNDLLRVQEEAYHAIETEDIPDQFAASVMKKIGLV